MVLAGDYAAIKERYGDVLGLIGDLCRSMMIPAPGHRFIVGDFSAVEARVLTSLAGDTDKLETFRQFDCGLGRDIYCVTAEQVLGLTDVQSKSPERRSGRSSSSGSGTRWGRQAAGHDPEGQHPDTRGSPSRDHALGAKMARPKPVIVGYWAALEAAAMAAVRNPDMTVPCRAIVFQMRDGVLFATSAIRTRAELSGAGD